MTNNDVCEVVITAPDADWLANFTRYLVEEHLAASGHNLAPIRSTYRWKGRIHDTSEARVALHTRRSLVKRIIQLTKENHPFEVPGVIAMPIIDGNDDYLQWIIDETEQE